MCETGQWVYRGSGMCSPRAERLGLHSQAVHCQAVHLRRCIGALCLVPELRLYRQRRFYSRLRLYGPACGGRPQGCVASTKPHVAPRAVTAAQPLCSKAQDARHGRLMLMSRALDPHEQGA